jgi:hypothetical protein
LQILLLILNRSISEDILLDIKNINIVQALDKTSVSQISIHDEEAFYGRYVSSLLQTLMTLITVVINYFLSWLPLHVITIVGDVNPTIYDSMSVHMIWVGAHVLAFSNSATNSMIYFWRNQSFRTAFQTLRRNGVARYRYEFNHPRRESDILTNRL